MRYDSFYHAVLVPEEHQQVSPDLSKHLRPEEAGALRTLGPPGPEGLWPRIFSFITFFCIVPARFWLGDWMGKGGEP